MIESPARYADWKAPAEDGATLLWPKASDILRQARENHSALHGAAAILVQNVPLPEIRRRQRQFLGHADDSQLLVATGHQTELYHAGVWVKNVVIDSIARRLDGVAYHIAVDTDSPKHLHFRWPGGSKPITDDRALSRAAWSALLRPPSPQHLQLVEATLDQARAAWPFEPMVGAFLRAIAADDAADLSSALTHGIASVDRDLGLTHQSLLASPIWMGEPYLVFAYDLMANAERFAGEYNAALAEYRRENGVRTVARPMPDLHRDASQCEVPFWLDRLSDGGRSRATVSLAGGIYRLTAPGGDAFVFDAALEGWKAAADLGRFLRQHELRLSPRALMLTMFLRLFAADQWVHGIGGGRYDQVTDRLIERHFALAAPRFSVATATLFFPTATGQHRINLRPLLQEGRRIRHGAFNREKRQLATTIDSLPRLSRVRRELFYKMHALLASTSDSPPMRQWESRLKEAEWNSVQQQAIFDRELFFALQPRERLAGAIEQFDRQFV